jgi:hypothetical protein
MVYGSRFIVSLASRKYHEKEIALDKCTIALTSIKNVTTKVSFPSKLPPKFMRGLDNYVVMWHVKDVVPK